MKFPFITMVIALSGGGAITGLYRGLCRRSSRIIRAGCIGQSRSGPHWRIDAERRGKGRVWRRLRDFCQQQLGFGAAGGTLGGKLNKQESVSRHTRPPGRRDFLCKDHPRVLGKR